MIGRWSAPIAVVALVVAGCSAQKPAPEAADTLSTRERQEALGRSSIPGARGVTKALEAADSARARAARLDTMPER